MKILFLQAPSFDSTDSGIEFFRFLHAHQA